MGIPAPVPPLTQQRRELVMCVARLATDNQAGYWALVNVTEGDTYTVMEFASPYMLRNHPISGVVTGSHRFRVIVELVTQEVPET